MKRFFLASLFCSLLLVGLACFLFPVANAAENPLLVLLDLPSPPPPNPQVPMRVNVNFLQGAGKKDPPPDDAPIEALLLFWTAVGLNSDDLVYKQPPTEKVLNRLLAEMDRNPSLAPELLNALPANSRVGDFVKGLHDRMRGSDEEQRDRRASLRRWLKYNTAHYSSELERDAAKVKDNNGYVTNHFDLLALARVDWDRAAPIVNRLYANSSQRASKTAALWALYLHAIESNSTSDTERYREELKETVEDKSLSDGIRDLALDALSLEKEWSGRDEWYMSLMEDETLLELGTYTGLTTLITASPDEKYVDRMIALLDSENINVRTAAARNLLTKLNRDRPEIVRALLPWLADPKWLRPNTRGRDQVIQALSRVKVPESVPVLIAALDERRPSGARTSPNTNAAWAVANAVNAAANAANAAANAVRMASNSTAASEMVATLDSPFGSFGYGNDEYPFRYPAITALAFQEDPRAVPALRRIFSELDQPYQLSAVVAAIYACGGFTIAEQVDAVEDIARNADEIPMGIATNINANANFSEKDIATLANFTRLELAGRDSRDMNQLLGILLTQRTTVKDDVARAVVDRIESLDRSDRKTADMIRKIVLRWDSPAVYALQLRDLKNGRVDAASLLRLLSVRQALREHLTSEVSSVRTGSQTALGISACLLEDPNDYEAILDGAGDEAKLALLACARLIRAPLTISKVAANLRSKDPRLALAAERYLVSEDSPEARRIALSLHPGAAKITGATTAFYFAPSNVDAQSLNLLFATVSPFHAQPASLGYGGGYNDAAIAANEEAIREELKKDPELLGVYNWEENYIHIYKTRVQLSWRDDPARYRERSLTKEEFDAFKAMISHHKADDLPPFLECHYCESREFLMLGRNGGRRVYLKSTTLPPFFAELDSAFRDLRKQPAVVKYRAAESVSGLEVLYADDLLDAKAVWKNGADFRLLVADKAKRIEIDQEIEALGEAEASDSPEDIDLPGPMEAPETSESLAASAVFRERIRRQYDHFAWRDFRSGAIGVPATQPNDVPYIPLKDDLPVPTTDAPWKATVGSLELRSDEKGLYKVVAGKLMKIRSGYYGAIVVTPDARWAVATKYDEDEGPRPVRVNLLTNREFAVQPGDLPAYKPLAFIPSINRVLLGPLEEEEEEETYSGRRPGSRSRNYCLLDPITGRLTATEVDFRPIAQQTFRPLQSTGVAFEYWTAIPDEKQTVVGTYNARNFTFRTLLTLPEIQFDSMDIWVDAGEGKVYFVYQGHLLSAPLKARP